MILESTWELVQCNDCILPTSFCNCSIIGVLMAAADSQPVKSSLEVMRSDCCSLLRLSSNDILQSCHCCIQLQWQMQDTQDKFKVLFLVGAPNIYENFYDNWLIQQKFYQISSTPAIISKLPLQITWSLISGLNTQTRLLINFHN